MDASTRKHLIERYRTGPNVLRKAWEAVPVAARIWRPDPNEWSAHEIIVHCGDSEAYAAIRIRLLAADPAPLIVGYDQVQWVSALGYHDLPAEPAVSVVDAVRASTSILLDRLTEEQWAATGTHTEAGPYSASDWLETYANHLHDHAEQIRRNVEAWRAAGGPSTG